ncbi:hypothetical protein Tco_1032744 [Tanacetum coccineum]|uniref:Uncharacterized protein n=1 Tax=Tanacetum coccineum TaxID=301880 RepID=A0ABQ5GDR8_9ASTR
MTRRNDRLGQIGRASGSRNSGAGRDQRNRGQQSHRAANSGACRRAAGTRLLCYSHLFPKFQDVFPEELPGIPPIRDVIQHLSSSRSRANYKATYRIAQIELKELKDQLQSSWMRDL